MQQKFSLSLIKKNKSFTTHWHGLWELFLKLNLHNLGPKNMELEGIQTAKRIGEERVEQFTIQN